MGGKESKALPISFDEALKRVSDVERRRMHEAFRRLCNHTSSSSLDSSSSSSSSSSTVSKSLFLREVVGSNVPLRLADRIHALCTNGNGNANGNGNMLSNNYNNVAFKDVLLLLVLVARGTTQERIQFMFSVLAGSGSASHLDRAEVLRFLKEVDDHVEPNVINAIFAEGDRCTYECFESFVLLNPNALSVSQWLLRPTSNVDLSSAQNLESPTFYQTLSGVTHLDESEIIELEKRFFNLISHSNTNQIDLSTVEALVQPLMPKALIKGLFEAFDENRDGHIDFKELSCGVSAACRGPEMERQKFCFKIFDLDHDGHLNRSEMETMCECLVAVMDQRHRNSRFRRLRLPSTHNIEDSTHGNSANDDIEGLLQSLSQSEGTKNALMLEEYLVWCVDNSHTNEFACLLFELCHVVLGLRPVSRHEEASVVRGWLQREESFEPKVGNIWHLVSPIWWTQWNAYVDASEEDHSSSQQTMSSEQQIVKSTSSQKNGNSEGRMMTLSQRRHLSIPSLDSTLASNLSSTVVGKSYQPLAEEDQRRGSKTPSITLTSRPGPIDNSGLVMPSPYRVPSLTGEGGKLRRSKSSNLVINRDYVIVPERLWKALVHWYSGFPSLPRQYIRNRHGDLELELFPVTLRLWKHQQSARGIAQAHSNASALASSYSAAASTLSGGGGSNGAVAGSVPCRRYHAYQSAFSRMTMIGQIAVFFSSRLHVKLEDLRLWHLRNDNELHMLDTEGSTLEDEAIVDDDSLIVEIRSRDGTWPEEISSLVVGNNSGEKGLNVDKRRYSTISVAHSTAEIGITGLTNLGNTCYLNSALQCVSHTKVLSQYFNRCCHILELNRVNPLGMKGHVAKRFGDLVKDMWAADARTVAPIKLRWTLGRYRPNFAGFQQQDAQELLAFLLDGLHEDLNRVADRPYVELKDSDGRPDVEVAKEAWENHLLRNRSIIVDLFHGQLKSKVICKVCRHESVRFDPFTYLSLPLPMESIVHVEVVVILQDGSTPVKYGLTLESQSRLSGIKGKLALLCKVLPQNLILVDIVQSQFRVLGLEEQRVKDLGSNVCIYAYEFSPISRTAGEAQSLSDIQRDTNDGSVGSEDVELMLDSSGSASLSSDENKQRLELEQERKDLDQIGFPNIDAKRNEELMNGSNPVFTGENSSIASTISIDNNNNAHPDTIGNCRLGAVVALHRKMLMQETYFLSAERHRPVLFGLPLLVTCREDTNNQDLYKSVWVQVKRLVSPLPPRDNTSNHATDCDDSLHYDYPFTLKLVQKDGCWCAECPWHRFCRGCPIKCSSDKYNFAASYIAIDWDQTALHLRYLSAHERAFKEDLSVSESLAAASESITLRKCLESFTRQEELGPDEKYYCSSCKTHQLASKRLQIWRLPPVLIIHLKRFHYLNGRWIKSHKIVDFPSDHFDPVDFLAAVPSATLKRFKTANHNCNGIIEERNEDGSLCSLDKEDDDYDDNNQNSDDDFRKEDDKKASSMTLDEAMAHELIRSRRRLQSTSLYNHPIRDDNLQDFHQHKLSGGKSPFDVNYNLYAFVSHSGVLGGGHYVAYTRSAKGKWYVHNDSTCKEVPESQVDKSTAYMLFYERDGLAMESYLPFVDADKLPDTRSIDEELDADFKKQCVLM